MQQQMVNRIVLVLVLLVISAAFIGIIQPFLLSIFLAALFAALFHPLYEKILKFTGQRRGIASLITILLVCCFVFIPLGMVTTVAIGQAVDIAKSATPWVQKQFAEPGMITAWLQKIPFLDQLEPYRNILVTQISEMVGSISKWTIELVQSATLGTFNALLMGLIVLYSMFFFLIDGDRLLYYILYYLPLSDDEEKQLMARFTSVTRATLKGTAVIGLMQGTLNGIAFSFAGIPSALFWAVAMVFLSVVPGIGTALVWVPAVIYLVAGGNFLVAGLLAGFCALIVGSLDNFLRPKLVGEETQLHELLIFFSTLGGLLTFGFWGFVIGPIIAALFVTIWGIYGDEFAEWLPTTAYIPKSGPMKMNKSGVAKNNHSNIDSKNSGPVNSDPGNTDSGNSDLKTDESSRS